MSENFCRITSSNTSNQSLKEKSIDINKEFLSLTSETPAILCKEVDGKMVPAVAPTTTVPTATSLPLYVYTKGSDYYEGLQYFGLVSVLGAAGIVRMTLAPGSAITAGDWVILTGSAGKVKPYNSEDTTNHQVIVGVALKTLSSSESDQELLVNSTVPRVVKLT